MKPIASIHNRAASRFGELLTRKLGNRISFEPIGSVLKDRPASGDLAAQGERAVFVKASPVRSGTGTAKSSIPSFLLTWERYE